MATLIEDTDMLVESICWHCTEAYATKCRFHDRVSGYTWEEKLEIPSKVATREVIVSSKPGQKNKYVSYRVLECPNYKPSARRRKELLREKGQRKKENALSKTKASKHVPSIETSNLNVCIICGTPTVDSIFCSNLCKAMGSGLSARGRKA
jgi:hypothetical protein